MIQNEAIHDTLPLTDYLVDIDELEKYVGLTFFPDLRYTQQNDSEAQQVVKYAELCKKYKCEYGDDERSAGWRILGLLKTAKTLDELEGVWRDCSEKELDADWMRSMFRREYFYRKKDLVRPIQRRINYMRRFQSDVM